MPSRELSIITNKSLGDLLTVTWICDKGTRLFELGLLNCKAYAKYYVSKVFIIIQFTSKLNHKSFYKMLSEMKFSKVNLEVEERLLETGKGGSGAGGRRLDVISAWLELSPEPH